LPNATNTACAGIWLNTTIFQHFRNGDIPKQYEKWMGELLKKFPTF